MLTKRIKIILILCIIAVCFISYFGMGNVFAKYVLKDDARAFSLDVLAKYKVTFDAGTGASMAAPDDGTWTRESDTTVSKIVENGQEYGAMPAPSKEHYAFRGWVSGSVPSGYTEVEYIESTGKEYIDTDLTMSDKVSFDCKIMRTSNVGNQGFFGYRFAGPVTSGNMRYFLVFSDGRFAIRYGLGYDNAAAPNLIVDNTPYHVNFDGTALFVNDKKYVTLTGCDSGKQYGTAYLFRSNTEGYDGSDLAFFKGRIYYFKVYDDGKLVRNFVPARNSSGEYGLYDFESDSFFTNVSGAGRFSGGPEVQGTHYEALNIVDPSSIVETHFDHVLHANWVPKYTVNLDAGEGSLDTNSVEVVYGEEYGELPVPLRTGYTFDGWTSNEVSDDYREVEYIQSSGLEYIDTGYPMTDKTSFSCELMKLDTNEHQAFFGYRFVDKASAVGDMRYFFILGIRQDSNDPGKIAIRYGVNGDNSSKKIALNTKYVLAFDGTCLSVDDEPFVEVSSRYSPASFGNAYLFAANTNGSGTNNYNADIKNLVGRIYSFKMYDDGTLVRDYVPVKAPSGAYGLYDLVSGEFFGNVSGKGAFTGGPEISPETSKYFAPVSSETIVEKQHDHSLYANWKPIEYTITYHYEKTGVSVCIPSAEKIADDDYIQIDYLDSNDGSLYFDIQYTPTPDTLIRSEYSITSKASFGLYGNRDKQTDGGFRFFSFDNNNSMYAARGGLPEYTQPLPMELNTRYVSVHSKTELSVNGVSYNSSGGASGDNYYPMIVMRDGYTGHSTKHAFFGRFYSMKIYEGEALKRDIVPCLRTGDSALGLYDKVDGLFFENYEKKPVVGYLPESQKCTYDKIAELLDSSSFASWNTKSDFSGTYYLVGQEVENLCTESGANIDLHAVPPVTVTFNRYSSTESIFTDDFAVRFFKAEVLGEGFNGWKDLLGNLYFDETGTYVGPELLSDITLVPDYSESSYNFVQYIQSDGYEYFDLQYIPCNATVIEAEFELDDTKPFGLYGNKNQETDGGYRLFKRVMVNNGQETLYASCGGGVAEIAPGTFTLQKDVRYSLTHSSSGLIINDTQCIVAQGGSNYYALLLLKDGYEAGDRLSYSFAGKLYSFKVYEGEKLIMDLRPCIGLAEGTVGLLNIAGGSCVFLRPQGSGSLLSGPELE